MSIDFDPLTGMGIAVDPLAETVEVSVDEAVEVEVKPGEGVTVEVDGEAADVDVAVSEEGVTVEVDSEAADVDVAVSEEGVTVGVDGAADVAVEVSDGISVGVGNIVGVEVAPPDPPEVSVLGFEVSTDTNPFAFLGDLFNLL